MENSAKKLSIDEWEALVDDVMRTDAEILAVSIVATGNWGFNLGLEPNPDFVDVPRDWYLNENAMRWANRRARRKRKRRFEKRLRSGDTSPVLVTETDSWGQFPLLIDDVIDHLNDNGFNCWSMGAAGDTAENIVYGPITKGGQEYMLGLEAQKTLVRAFVFSAAGNDIIGESPDTGRAELDGLVKGFNGDINDVEGHVDRPALVARLKELKEAYSRVISTIRADPSFTRLPIIIHGYDVPYPYPWGENDKRTPFYLLGRNDKWLGSVFDNKDIPNKPLGRAILEVLIDALYKMLHELAGDPRKTHVWVVNCRGSLPELTDWNDEIHGTSTSYRGVADRFIGILNQAISHAESTA